MIGHAIVLGAGSAGLASAAALGRSGWEVVVLEAGEEVGHRWRHRYRSLRLNTLRALSGLPGLAIPKSEGNWPSGAGFAAYLRTYAEHHRLDVRTSTPALAVTRDAAWQVDTPDGRLAADVLVVATGNAAEPVVPDWAADFTGEVLHSADYRVPEPFTGKHVLVVGSGNSATEIATDLVAHAQSVRLSVRTAPLLVPTSNLGVSTHRVSVLGSRLPDALWDKLSLGSHWSLYRDLVRYGLGTPAVGSHTRFRQTGMAPVAERGFARAVRDGRIEVVPGTRKAHGGEVLLDDDRTVRPDVLVLATGYRPSFPSLLSDLGVLEPNGKPLHWGAPLPGAPGLFVVGGPSLQGDIREHGREAVRVARLAASTSTREGAR
ncbi:MAG: NAD(P)/FAD-dependent oxidoreductase [Saccharothrix sp.]|nr:NAD(P)/FAD-dependent oxidoreductase [Saccharothrix sp.]